MFLQSTGRYAYTAVCYINWHILCRPICVFVEDSMKWKFNNIHEYMSMALGRAASPTFLLIIKSQENW